MKRYLLFNAGCAYCTTLAERIEQESQGWLQAKSLREPEMQTYLEQAGHQLRWEPTLLEVSEEHVRVFTGWAFRRKLLLGLGLQRMWRVLSLIDSQRQSPSHSERRQFFRLGGALLSGLVLGLGWRGGLPASAAPAQPGPLYDQTLLAASQARQLFEQHPLLQQAQVHFGAIDWSEVTRFTHRETQEISYGLKLVSGSGVPSLLMLSDTVSQTSASSKGLVLQVYADGNGRSTFHLFLPDGAYQGSLTLDQGKLVPSQPDGAGGIVGKLICVAACAAAADTLGKGGCVGYCQTCALGSGLSRIVACSYCLICAGPDIYRCFKNC